MFVMQSRSFSVKVTTTHSAFYLTLNLNYFTRFELHSSDDPIICNTHHKNQNRAFAKYRSYFAVHNKENQNE